MAVVFTPHSTGTPIVIGGQTGSGPFPKYSVSKSVNILSQEGTILNSKYDININGKIIPNTCNIFDLGSTDFKWRDLFLSGKTIYLDNMSINNSNNYLSTSNINISHITIRNNINSNSKSISLNTNGDMMISNKFLLAIDNKLQISNIVFSNVFNNASNTIYNLNNNRFNSIKSFDNIPIGLNNKFIINDTYSNIVNFPKTVQTNNLITSNLNVIGDYTIFNTTIYQTEQLQVVNDTTATAMIVKQMQFNKNVAEFYHQNSNLTLILNSNGNIGIGITNPLYKLELSTSTNPIRISNSSTTANNAIQIQNNSTFIANIGVGGTAIAGNYQNNLFLESSSGAIILNSSGKTSITSPSMIIGANSYIGIGTNPTVPLTLGNFTGNKIISAFSN
jgi:hypothetical protein